MSFIKIHRWEGSEKLVDYFGVGSNFLYQYSILPATSIIFGSWILDRHITHLWLVCLGCDMNIPYRLWHNLMGSRILTVSKKAKSPHGRRNLGPIWYVILNTYFQFLNNITRISTYFFTHTYFQKNWKLLFKHRVYLDGAYFCWNWKLKLKIL